MGDTNPLFCVPITLLRRSNLNNKSETENTDNYQEMIRIRYNQKNPANTSKSQQPQYKKA